MASFRTGFKIFGEISLKQGLGRIRSFSEDKKPVQWLPEDQWAVRQPGSTCPDPCEKKKKPPKPSKSWLSLCNDPDALKDPECDVRHNNCPPPPVKDSSPWYSLGKLIPKKKPSEKPPPLQSCCEERRRRELSGEDDEVCENPECVPTPEPPACIPRESCPAPVVTLSCPVPKELNLMLWCDCGKSNSAKIPIKCEADRLPYDEFRPQKIWKPPPFSLPIKYEPTLSFPPYCSSTIAYSEFKQIDVPRPLYTRYKSVELGSSSTLLCMTDVHCPDDQNFKLGVTSNLPPPPPLPLSKEPVEKEKNVVCPEKRVLEAGSRKPVKVKKASKFAFRPKPTKLLERRIYRDCHGNKKSDLPFRTQIETDESDSKPEAKSPCVKTPKVKTESHTKEPKIYERVQPTCRPPKWMFALCKPGSKKCPLLPCSKEFSKGSSETGELESSDESSPRNILSSNVKNEKTKPSSSPSSKPPAIKVQQVQNDSKKCKSRFVLMPDKYNIKLMRQKSSVVKDTPFEKIIEKNATLANPCPSSFLPIKENILYDLQRMCPEPPLDPSKLNLPCRKPPKPLNPKFYRSISTLTPALRKLCSPELFEIPRRTECSDTSGKCKARDLTPKRGPCPDPLPGTECADLRLPCCPKARVPPNCNVKKPLPMCKKKLAPKPSFSECAKDPPPCPRNTECNCWNKNPSRK